MEAFKKGIVSIRRFGKEHPHTPYQKLTQHGFALLTDLLAQNLNLIVNLQEEVTRIEAKEEEDSGQSAHKKESGSPISVRAFRSAIVLPQFSVLETLANFLAGLAIKTMEGISGAPATGSTLTQVEIDFLKEQRTSVDAKTGSLKVSRSVFNPTLDKLAIVPLLLGKLHRCPFRLDKSGSGWQSLRDLKETRDKLVQFKLDDTWLSLEEDFEFDIDNVKPQVIIRNWDLFAGSQALRWYIQQIKGLLKDIYGDKGVHPNQEPLLLSFTMLEFVCWRMLASLYEDCGISKNDFDREYPLPKGIQIIESPNLT